MLKTNELMFKKKEKGRRIYQSIGWGFMCEKQWRMWNEEVAQQHLSYQSSAAFVCLPSTGNSSILYLLFQEQKAMWYQCLFCWRSIFLTYFSASISFLVSLVDLWFSLGVPSARHEVMVWRKMSEGNQLIRCVFQWLQYKDPLWTGESSLSGTGEK